MAADLAVGVLVLPSLLLTQTGKLPATSINELGVALECEAGKTHNGDEQSAIRNQLD